MMKNDAKRKHLQSYKMISDHGWMLKVSIIFVTFFFGAHEFPTSPISHQSKGEALHAKHQIDEVFPRQLAS